MTPVLLASIAWGQPMYSAQDIGTIPGAVGNSWAGDLNEVGEVCGYADAPNGRSIHALYWDGQNIIDLRTLGTPYSWAYGINNSAQITGYSGVDSVTIHGFIWENGEMIDIGSLPGSRGGFSRGNAINESGMIAGVCHGTGPGMVVPYAGFLLDAGHWTEIPTFGGTESRGQALNDDGLVVGWARFDEPNPISPRALLWSNDTLIDIGTLGGNRSQAAAINNAGLVVGGATDANEVEHAFQWREGGDLIPLPELSGAQSWANDLNERGQIIGWSVDDQDVQRGVLWQDGQLWDLNAIVDDPQDAFFHNARAINELGQILVSGTLEDNLKHIYLLTPTNMPVLGKPTPGQAGTWNELTATNFKPGARVLLAASQSAGTVRIPGCETVLNLQGGRLLTTAIANSEGRAQWRVAVPNAAAGRRIFIQAMDRTRCTATNLIRFEFE